jgi:hypothetical protein
MWSPLVFLAIVFPWFFCEYDPKLAIGLHEHLGDAVALTDSGIDVGDMLVYSGCELEHWREPFDGNICGQVFLHYNHVNGPFADKNKFDGRPKLGLPAFVK